MSQWWRRLFTRLSLWMRTINIRSVIIFGISLLITIAVIVVAINYVLTNFIYPVDPNDATPVIVVVEPSDSASTIATKLLDACGKGEEGLISNKAVFKVYVDFLGKANKLRSGTYVLSKNMDLQQIVDILCKGTSQQEITITIPEGSSIEDIANILKEKNLITDASEFFDLCKNPDEQFSNYDFIAELPKSSLEKRDYALEGYLFPDTYKVFVDSAPATVINKLLLRFNEIFTEDYAARAEELDMTTDEVIALASIIEREAQHKDDFAKVSAVFHNRLKKNMNLESCATLQYVLKVKKYEYNASEIQTKSPFNTYLNSGLPVGAISNPGKLAIEAALYPNEEYIEENYLYFCNGKPSEDPDKPTPLVFAKTYEQHKKNQDQYRPYWK